MLQSMQSTTAHCVYTALAVVLGLVWAPPILAYVPGVRWTTTASGSVGTEGDPTTLTWSLARDGTSIPEEGASNLIGFLDGLFNVTSGGTNFAARPWFGLFEESFDRWEQLSGINFVYEPNDYNVELATGAGLLGFHGDVRIGGQTIDGSGGTLAYAFLPDNSDIVIDTSETAFFGNSANNYRAFRNTLMHEIGHAFGLDHLVSSSDNLLMEPTINSAFDGPQLDDIRGVQAFYGDALEKSNLGQGNDTSTLAYSLGSLTNGGSVTIGANAVGGQAVGASETDFVSIANTDDVDFYSFTVAAASALDASLTPLGGAFVQGSQGGSQSSFNAAARNDLSLTIFGPNGTTAIASANSTAVGQAESLSDVRLTVPGTYFVRVLGAADAVQLYQLQLSATALTPELLGDFNLDGVVDASDYVVWRKTFNQTGASLAADANFDQFVSASDYQIWRTRFGETATGSSSSNHSGVPEPGALSVLAVVAAFMCLTQQRRANVGSRDTKVICCKAGES
jgi:serralysin